MTLRVMRVKEYRDLQTHLGDGETEAQRGHRIVFKAQSPTLVLSTLADTPHLIYEGADADGAPLDEIQTGLVVLVVDK